MNITINPQGFVSKEGNEIGFIKGDVCTLYKRPGPSDYKAIKEAAGNDKLNFDIMPENAPPPSTPPPAPAPPDNPPAETPPVAEIPPTSPPAKPRGPEPKQHPSMGQKDPAWLAWKNGQ